MRPDARGCPVFFTTEIQRPRRDLNRRKKQPTTETEVLNREIGEKRESGVVNHGMAGIFAGGVLGVGLNHFRNLPEGGTHGVKWLKKGLNLEFGLMVERSKIHF